METQFQYITNLANQYKELSENKDSLLGEINKLPQNVVEEVFSEYGSVDKNFQPVNLLRSEVARLLSNSVKITQPLVEELKKHIREKDAAYFSHLSKDYLTQLENYRFGNRDVFANWQSYWNVFHVFFYRGVIKDTVRMYLEQMAKQLNHDLGLSEYDYHWVDFYGSSNFGSVFCLSLIHISEPTRPY